MRIKVIRSFMFSPVGREKAKSKDKNKVKCPAWDISGFRILFLIGRE